jgi:hypothetical protein
MFAVALLPMLVVSEFVRRRREEVTMAVDDLEDLY